ncbi:MAG: TrmH family RNA methyltransferase [Patescibacteria group bacterium]
MIKLNARELRTTMPDPHVVQSIHKNPITIILDNVLDTYNVGSIFRLADAVAAEKVYLCGETLTPPNSRIKKASINTWNWVEWEYKKTAKEAVETCRMSHVSCHIVAVEQDERSKPFYKVQYDFPLAIVVGNETTGVSKEILDMADTIVELPMWGINKSLNVMVSLGIVLYEIASREARSGFARKHYDH